MIIRTAESELVTVQGQPDYHRCLDPDAYDEKIKTAEAVRAVLKQLTFAPSCVDMNWGWQIEQIYVDHPEYICSTTADPFPGITKRAVVEAGYRLRTTFRRPDRETGEVAEGFGRWWEVPQETTVSAVVKTAFAACKMILEHELMESFKWKNARVFDPHNTVQELASLGSTRYIDTIP